jgi:LytR cell envelope-related transcriptional attenuator
MALLSVAAVVLAAAAYVATDRPEAPAQAAQPVVRPTVTPSVTVTAKPVSPTRHVAKKKAKRPSVKRGDTYVEVYNNSGIHGLAGSTAAKAQGAGWQVVGSDNWYGTIEASTVYYPERLHDAAKLLAKDLGIGRLRPSIAPMRGDRLTVILTSDYRG